MKIARSTMLTLSAALVLAACSDGRSANDAYTDQTQNAQGTGEATSGMGTMGGMQDTQGMGRNALTEQVQADLRRMDGAGAESIQAMVPSHREMVTNMIAQFKTDMRSGSTSDTTAWAATVDSVEQDLRRMQDMSATELQRLMPGHGARVRRLMDTHGTVVGSIER